jgi:hypothetical protein
MRVVTSIALAGALGLFGGCAGEAQDSVALPPSGTAYRALNAGDRLDVAASCRDRTAAAADGAAAAELRAVDPAALRADLDDAFALTVNQRRAVAEVCAERLPFVTPGWRFAFDRAMRVGNRFSYQTSSEKPLTLSGAVSPAPRDGRVVVRREFGRSAAYRAEIGPDGRFVLPAIRLRKMADNSFVVAFHAASSAVRKVQFSAICMDCLAGAPPPAPANQD